VTSLPSQHPGKRLCTGDLCAGREGGRARARWSGLDPTGEFSVICWSLGSVMSFLPPSSERGVCYM
jgi:hypothetical protein